MLKFKSLHQRLAVLLLLPVTLLLLGVGVLGFTYASNSLFALWKDGAVTSLAQLAHRVDMRLGHIKDLLQMFDKTGNLAASVAIQDWLLELLKNDQGVVRVVMTWGDDQTNRPYRMHYGATDPETGGLLSMGHVKMRFNRANIKAITSPQYDSITDHDTVSLISDLKDENGQEIGRLEVVVRFDYLVQDVVGEKQLKNLKVFLVDDTGKVLTCNVHNGLKRLGDDDEPLAIRTLHAIKLDHHGTLLGEGHPPSEVSGFYQLREAPWVLVVFAPGKEVLAPIIKFRVYYILTGLVFVLVILLLIRLVTGRTVAAIRRVSDAARNIAVGHYGDPLPVRTEDEVGQLTSSFNSMTAQLEEGIRLKQALDLAVEIQQSFLPKGSPPINGLDIAGKAIYCDETGGDYYDFLHFFELGDGRVAVAVGDVVGHGIGAALLMTTARAFLRCRVTQAGSTAAMITDVNRLLCMDTALTGDFMTLFFLLLDFNRREIQWVRAGHDPAIVYDLHRDSFSELKGEGMALGVDEIFEYQDQVSSEWLIGKVILIGTDGIWEAENPHGELYGKERLKDVIRRSGHLTAEAITADIISDLDDFRQTAAQKDDITLVVLKAAD